MAYTKFEWSDDYSVGVDEMDNEHKVLIGYINELIDCLDKDSGIAEAFKKMATYCIKHFEDEEALMERENYEGLGSHKIIHKNLIAKVQGFGEQIDSGTINKDDLVSFLKMWLSAHIMGIDRKYGQTFGKLAA